MSTRPRRLTTLGLAAILGLSGVLAACGGDDDAASDTPAPTAADAATATSTASGTPTSAAAPAGPDLSGVTLKVGDQADLKLQKILAGSGEEAKAPYKIEWSTFQSGPQMIAAETGGSVDIGKMSETPLVFAQAAGSKVTVVYAAKPLDPTTSSLSIVVQPDSDIKTVADLKGKKVAITPGTVLQYLLEGALADAGLTMDDVELVALPPGTGDTALANGDVDAMGSGDPTWAIGEAAGRVKLLVSGAEYTPGFHYLVAANGALGNDLKKAAIADFAQRVARAEQWFNSNTAAATAIIAEQFKVDPAVAKTIVERAPIEYGPIDDSILEAHQEEADTFKELGIIPDALDTSKVFDATVVGAP